MHSSQTSALALGNQQDPVLILGHVSRHTTRALAVLLFPLDAQLVERALDVLCEVYNWISESRF